MRVIARSGSHGNLRPTRGRRQADTRQARENRASRLKARGVMPNADWKRRVRCRRDIPRSALASATPDPKSTIRRAASRARSSHEQGTDSISATRLPKKICRAQRPRPTPRVGAQRTCVAYPPGGTARSGGRRPSIPGYKRIRRRAVFRPGRRAGRIACRQPSRFVRGRSNGVRPANCYRAPASKDHPAGSRCPRCPRPEVSDRSAHRPCREGEKRFLRVRSPLLAATRRRESRSVRLPHRVSADESLRPSRLDYRLARSEATMDDANAEQVRDAVREHYGKVAEADAPGCAPGCCGGGPARA